MDALLDTAARAAATASRRPRSDAIAKLHGGLSDEVCRPLIAIRAGCDLLLAGAEGPITPDQQSHIWALRSQCDDMLRLTRSYLLDYAGIPLAARRLHWSVFRLGALLDEADRQFAEVARARGIAWACRLEEDDGPVETDLSCFQQVLARLVENALAHTPEGGRVVVVGRIEGDRWRVAVVDDGPGIPAESIARAFEPLVRLAPGRPGGPDRAGHGMGLAVCRELVDGLGGELALRSRPDAGTSALLDFPVARPACPG